MRLVSLPLLCFALVVPARHACAQESTPPTATPPAVEAAPATPPPADAAAPAAPPEGATPAAEPAAPTYDEIVVKGATLHGHVLSFSDKSVTFETIYGKGKIEI